MKRIPISNNYSLHVYLVEEKTVGDIFEQIQKYESAESDLGEPFDSYRKGSQDFLELMQKNHCMAFVQELADTLVRDIVQHWQIFSPGKLETERYQRFVKYLEILDK